LLNNSDPGSTVVLTLSRLDEVKLTVSLGGRPVNRMNADDMEIARRDSRSGGGFRRASAAYVDPRSIGRIDAQVDQRLAEATVLP